MANARKFDLADFTIAVLLMGAYLALLLQTAGQLGFARDEGFYFHAARSYEAWFDLLSTDRARALDPSTIDRYWGVNHEHPGLIKSLFALSHRYLGTLFHEQSTAYRFPAMVLSALGVATTYVWGKRELGGLAGLVAALSFALMPHVFYHAHLACFDIPVTALLLITTFAFARSLEGGLAWAIITAVLYGLLLDTKHNAWLLPGAFGVHFLLTRGWHALRELRRKRWAVPHAFPAMLVISPLVFYAGWPWIWHETLPRLQAYARFHLQHEYYNMEFLGQTYWKPPMPRLYAWVMTLATVPSITLVLFVLGLGVSAAHAWRLQRRPSESVIDSAPAPSTALLWLLCVLMCYAPWWSPSTPIFGGTKHWMTAYPFLCLFAGAGFAAAARQLAELWPRLRSVAPLLASSVLVAPLVMTLHSEPWGLSFYTPLVGGAPGAADLGLNRTFWGYTTGSVAAFINEQAPPRASIFVHDTALSSWEMFKTDGRIRADLRGTEGIQGTSLALYHHEQHMGRVEYQTWVDYGHAAPAVVAGLDGVPIVWVYQR